MSYNLKYSGIETDELLQAINPDETLYIDDWVALSSTFVNKFNLNTLRTPGNYTVSYWANGPEGAFAPSPINVMVKAEPDGSITQIAVIGGTSYKRTLSGEPEEFSKWAAETRSDKFAISDSEPTNPGNLDLWMDTSAGGAPVFKVYHAESDTWVSARPSNILIAKIYDPTNMAEDIFLYIDTAISNADVTAQLADFNLHTSNTEYHTSVAEKNEWKGKATIDAMNGIISTFSDTMKASVTAATDTTYQSEIALMRNISGYLNTLDRHATDTTIHPTPENIALWEGGADSNHTHYNNGTVKLSTSAIKSPVHGVRIDPSALESMVTVDNISEMNALKTGDCQTGDIVYVRTMPTNISAIFITTDATKFGTDDINLYLDYDVNAFGDAPAAPHFYKVTKANNVYFAVSNEVSDGLTYSHNTVDWYTYTVAPAVHKDVYYGCGIFICFDEGSNYINFSKDNISWKGMDTSLGNRSYSAIASDGNRILVVATPLADNTDTNTYVLIITYVPATDTIAIAKTTIVGYTKVEYLNNRFYLINEKATGSAHKIAHSTDGVTWTEVSLTVSGMTNTVAPILLYNKKYFALIGSTSAPYLFSSTDGLTWVNEQLPTRLSISCKGMSFYNYGDRIIIAYLTTTNTFPIAACLATQVNISASWTLHTSNLSWPLTSIHMVYKKYCIASARVDKTVKFVAMNILTGKTYITELSEYNIPLGIENAGNIIAMVDCVSGDDTLLTVPNGTRDTIRVTFVNDAFHLFTKTDSGDLSWYSLLDKPSTMQGYGITDAYNKADAMALIADSNAYITQAEPILVQFDPIIGIDFSGTQSAIDSVMEKVPPIVRDVTSLIDTAYEVYETAGFNISTLV